MEREDEIIREAEQPSENREAKSLLQLQKESWYEKVPLTVKQLDIIIAVAVILLALTFLVIFLDARDIFNPFGY